MFKGDVSLLATPSNVVEVAFATSRDGDGILLSGDGADESVSVRVGADPWLLILR